MLFLAILKIGEAFIDSLNKKLEELINNIKGMDILPTRICVDFHTHVYRISHQFDHKNHSKHLKSAKPQYMAWFEFDMEYANFDTEYDTRKENQDKLLSYSEEYFVGAIVNHLHKQLLAERFGRLQNYEYAMQSREDLFKALKKDVYSFIPKIDLGKIPKYTFELYHRTFGRDYSEVRNYIAKGRFMERYVKSIEIQPTHLEQKDDER